MPRIIKGKFASHEKTLDLIHIDLMGPTRLENLRGKKYIFWLLIIFEIFVTVVSA